MSESLLLRHLPQTDNPSTDELLEGFLHYIEAKGLELYPAQEEAILALFEDQNVILNTPTGSGKSLVATAMHFRSLALGRNSVYTCPIKALVNEKFLQLCRDFGPELVGMTTGDASVNSQAPILCCTAEVLANHALRDGTATRFHDVIMDEFHYYSDHERGVAWQTPLLSMPHARFLLMSATMGSLDFFRDELTKHTETETLIVSSKQRPVPLHFEYVETSTDQTLQQLISENKAPVYLVHFTQNEAAQAAQDLMSLNFCNSEEKLSIKEQLVGVKFNSPYGKDLKKYLLHGLGIHHAGLLPRYRILVEKLAQMGLLKVICGTDTLGVGVNVPIRSVLLTRLSKYGGQKVATLSARDFHQITGRAGRRGYDDIGYVVAQAPEHVIENAKLEAKAAGDPKKMRKMVKKKPPEGFVGWNEDTFKKLQIAEAEPLVSRFKVSQGMLLQVLSRDSDGCKAMQKLITDSHESASTKKKLRKRSWELFRALLSRQIISILPKEQWQAGRKLQLNVELQDDFSLTHTLSLYLLDTLQLIDPQSSHYAADILTLCESIIEDPQLILKRQVNKLKGEAMNAMKADGIPYEERIERLEEIEHPKPCRDFIYRTFNAFSDRHPWIEQENIHLKSVVREMYENFRSFTDYVKDYDLHRFEGVLLRHISNVYKVLCQTVPAQYKTEEVQEMEAWLAGILRGTDSSLVDEWEQLRDPVAHLEKQQQAAQEEQADITRDKREFTALIRNEIFSFLRAIIHHQTNLALSIVHGSFNEAKLNNALDDYYSEHDRIRLDTEARNKRHTYIDHQSDPSIWKIDQIVLDSDDLNDWQLRFQVNLEDARAQGKPKLELIAFEAVLDTETNTLD